MDEEEEDEVDEEEDDEDGNEDDDQEDDGGEEDDEDVSTEDIEREAQKNRLERRRRRTSPGDGRDARRPCGSDRGRRSGWARQTAPAALSQRMASLAARALAAAAARPTARLAPVRLASTVAAPATATAALDRWAKPAPPQAPTRKTPEERRAARARALGRPVKQQGAAAGRSSAKLPLLPLPEALKVLRASTRARFDETVEVALGCKFEKGYATAARRARAFAVGLKGCLTAGGLF